MIHLRCGCGRNHPMCNSGTAHDDKLRIFSTTTGDDGKKVNCPWCLTIVEEMSEDE